LDNSINPEAIINSAVTSLISKRRGGLTDRLWGKLFSHFSVVRADLAVVDGNTTSFRGETFVQVPHDWAGIVSFPRMIETIRGGNDEA